MGRNDAYLCELLLSDDGVSGVPFVVFDPSPIDDLEPRGRHEKGNAVRRSACDRIGQHVDLEKVRKPFEMIDLTWLDDPVMGQVESHKSGSFAKWLD